MRLGSLSPNVITEKFLSYISRIDNFMPHLHLSLQSCNDSVLTDMKRPYRKKDIFDRVSLIREYIPNCMLSADIIVGFPGETESKFVETVEALKELNVFHVHSFPYSERPGTIAAEMVDKVPKNERAERNSRLIAACAETKHRILNSKINQNVSVLIEKIVEGKAFGHTEQFLEASFCADNCRVGEIVEIRIVSHDGDILHGVKF